MEYRFLAMKLEGRVLVITLHRPPTNPLNGEFGRELFEAVPWSTSDVLEVTLRRAAAVGLRAVCLPSWFDVDTRDDLERLRTMLEADNATTACQTRRFLASWRR